MEHWTKAIDDGLPVDTLYLDFQKAFDSVPHHRLIHKLSCYGINGEILRWIEKFLTGRKQRVIVNGIFSSWTDVSSGIPQGSVLGPTLFVCYINDLPQIVASTIAIFADDTKIYRTIRNEDDRALLQKDIDALKAWSERWQLPFNDSKCKILHLGSRNQHYAYYMGNSLLQTTLTEKDLGVHIDCDLKFHQHVNLSVKKANRILGLIKHTFNNLDEVTLPLLYKTMVRPHLEYANSIWHPRFVGDIQEIEKVQRRATRLVPHLANLSYEQRLEALDLPSLKYRRLRGDLIQVFKIMYGHDRLEPTLFFTPSHYTATRGHSKKLAKPQSATHLRQHVFSNRIVIAWNALPQHVIEAPTINTFKSLLDNHLSNERYLY
jgi:hypothetical protein